MGVVLVAVMALAGAGVAQAAWSGMDPLGTGRYNHTATVLQDGRVLVAGGSDGDPLSSARLYDPKAGTWSDAASMQYARQGQAAVLLHSGKVLVAGGYAPAADAGAPAGYARTAEIYDPASDTWTQAASMGTGRFEPTMTVLEDGRVLVAGGVGDVSTPDGMRAAVALDSAEVYDPAADRWTDVAPMSVARSLDSATLLPSGKVLVAGGYDNATGELGSAELFDPATGDWSATAPLAQARDAATATALPNGDVLVAGGDNGTGAALASAEVYRADAGTWQAAGSMAGKREAAAAALLKDGTVLVAGGKDARLGGLLNTTERYDPASGEWTDAGPMSIARAQHTLTALGDGRALVVGGDLGGFAGGSTDVERFSAATTNLTPLTFGRRAIGSTSDAQSAVLTNTGRVPVDVSTVSIAGGGAKDFAIASDTCSAATIAPGDTCTIDVTFTPSANGARAATLTVVDTTASGTTSATLAGSGPQPASAADGTPAADAPSAPSVPSAPAAGGAIAVPKAGIGVGPDAVQSRHRAAARATCKVTRAHGRSTVTCTVAWPAAKAVALRARLMRGKKVVARARATARGGRAVIRLRPAARLRGGRYTVAIADGATVLRSAVRA